MMFFLKKSLLVPELLISQTFGFSDPFWASFQPLIRGRGSGFGASVL
jgi:hypothetical protein